MFSVQEVAEFVRGTLASMPSTVHIGQAMDVVKLQSISRTVDSRLFAFPGENLIFSFKGLLLNIIRQVDDAFCTNI